MRKNIYIAFALVAVLITSCKKTDPVVVYDHTSAEDAIGVYVGHWLEISSEGDTTLATGNITISANDVVQPNICKVTITNDSAEWKTKSAIANVAHAGGNGDIVFNNDATTNTLGSTFAGRIYGDGRAIFTCNLSVEVEALTEKGKPYLKIILVNYTFDGKKQ